MGKILFIGWDYQNYTREMVAELGKQFFSVTYHPLHPKSGDLYPPNGQPM